MERLRGGLGIVPEGVLHADAERREEQRPLDALVVHHLQPRVAVAVLRPDRLELAERLDDRLLRRVAPVPVEERARAWPRGRRWGWRRRS